MQERKPPHTFSSCSKSKHTVVYFYCVPSYLHYASYLLHLALSWEERVACVELGQYAAQTPHVDGHAVWVTQDHLRRPVEATLDVGVHWQKGKRDNVWDLQTFQNWTFLWKENIFPLLTSLLLITAWSKINYLDVSWPPLRQKDVFLLKADAETFKQAAVFYHTRRWSNICSFPGDSFAVLFLHLLLNKKLWFTWAFIDVTVIDISCVSPSYIHCRSLIDIIDHEHVNLMCIYIYIYI